MLFIKNKYLRIYFNIINNAKTTDRARGEGIYYEEHHIFPKSLFPEYITKRWNTILLTAKEHFVVHHLLVKFTQGEHKSKMYFAFNHMCVYNKNQPRYKPSARLYNRVKKEISKIRISLFNSPEWKNTIGKEKTRKLKLTNNSPEWKNTIGKEKILNILKLKQINIGKLQ